MDSFFVTGVDPKSIMSQNKEAIKKLFFYSFLSNFVKNSILSLPRYEQKSGAQPQLYTPFVLRTFVDSELRSRRNRTFDGPALFYAPLYPERKISFAPMGARRSRESNPVPQDPISGIHPPCIYAGDVASAMGFGLCRSKMMNGIVVLHPPLMRKDAAERMEQCFALLDTSNPI
ncbi:putative cytochrome c biosynthesis protein [Sesamum alatum]|uniref:Cytochrome c biosynthesis protein n=1 Tax=Sesamum alatum TaxID=300844 RepID=A0AAE2CA82_9LAMI|nr:putative cytochrome c biosynthesis protein [Sesamum alatum]